MKRMLVNATQEEELRVALVDGQKLFDLSIELPSREQKKANVYKGRISRIEPSLEACFVDYGAQRHGFLPLKEVAKEFFRQQPQGGRMNIRELLSEGQEIIVQVEKEERGTKGAALTTYISLAGRFCVLMPNSPRGGGISRKITSAGGRRPVKEIAAELDIPQGMGVIVRTAGANRPKPEIKRDCEYLMRLWDDIREHTMKSVAPALIYEEASLIKRTIRDVYARDIDEILVDGEEGWRAAHDFMRMLMPG